MLYIISKALEIFNSLYWLKGSEFYIGSMPRVLYWLKGFEFYIGSKALGFILSQRLCALYWLKGPEINYKLYTSY